jgi:hypothetical protein
VPLIKVSLPSELDGFMVLGRFEEAEELPAVVEEVLDGSANSKNGFNRRRNTSTEIFDLPTDP